MHSKGSIIILLLGLLFIKVSAFHVYEHQDADNQIEVCGYCDLAIENQQTELSPGFSVPEFVPQPLIQLTAKIRPQSDLVRSEHLTSFILTRPPPAVI